jgi:hypothetical protein
MVMCFSGAEEATVDFLPVASDTKASCTAAVCAMFLASVNKGPSGLNGHIRTDSQQTKN